MLSVLQMLSGAAISQMSHTKRSGRRTFELKKVDTGLTTLELQTHFPLPPLLKSNLKNQISVPARFSLMAITAPIIHSIGEQEGALEAPGQPPPFQEDRGRAAELQND